MPKRSWILIGIGLALIVALSISICAVLFERGVLTGVRGVCLYPTSATVCFSQAETLSQRETTAIVTSPDGQILASSHGKKIQLWNLRTGKSLALLAGHSGWVSAIAFSPDSKTLASGSLDRTIRLWNLDTRKLLSTFVAGRMTDLAFSPDGQMLAGSSRYRLWLDGQPGSSGVQLWDLKTGQQLRPLGSVPLTALAFSPNGQVLATGGSDTQLWDLTTRRLLYTLNSGRVTNLAFSPDGQILVSGSSKIKVWQVSTGELIYTLKSGSSDLALSPDGQTLAVSSGGIVELWKVETGKLLGALQGSKYSNLHVAFGLNGQIIISGASNGIGIWRARWQKGAILQPQMPDNAP
ncbi:MAG: WD40 repeat domain-containing protein [Chroococcidiopsidaceae cyanobacterium CP_BM_RX_35]|nr:WD40 repeat domain-containing protein [Chroococcidiopsidaceae cyanobacterium CP_BM_RX_35]